MTEPKEVARVLMGIPHCCGRCESWLFSALVADYPPRAQCGHPDTNLKGKVQSVYDGGNCLGFSFKLPAQESGQ